MSKYFQIVLAAVPLAFVLGCQGATTEQALTIDNGEEESGRQYALDETYDMVRNGVRLLLSYDKGDSVFSGHVENTTNETKPTVRVEVHLSNGTELGPTTPVDLAPGASTNIELSAEGQIFEWWKAHPETGSEEHGAGHEEGGEHSREHSGGAPSGPLITPGNFTLDYETDEDGVVAAISQSDYRDPGYNNFDYMGNESGDVFVEDGTYYWFYHGFGDKDYQIGLRLSDSPTGPWTRWGSDPIVAMTEPWENFYVACPMIVKDGGTYYMFYTASRNRDDQVSICLATASSLTGPWTKYSGNPVYIYDYDTEGHHYNGGVLHVDGEWRLYSIQFDEIEPDHGHCYMATADAPEGPWTYRTEPVITAGPAGAWDAGGFSEFEVYYWNGEYHAFYGAGDDLPDSVTWEDESIGYAWSEDGINWTKYNDPSTGGAYAESDPLIDQEDVPNAQTMGQPFGFIDYPNIYLYYTLKYATCRPELNPCEIGPGDGGPWIEDLAILKVAVTGAQDTDPPTP